MKALGLISTMALFVLAAGSSLAETVVVPAGRDATLIEDPEGALANGSGPTLFAGRTSQFEGSIRRALIRFDVASAVPARAIVEHVALRLFVLPSNPQPGALILHRVQTDWGEGPSADGGGRGAPAQEGDATWLHTFYDRDTWVRAGAHFVARETARLEVADSGHYTWEGDHHLVQDVRLWVHAPRRNHGWLLLGDESAPQTAKAIASREHPMLSLRPVLIVNYRMPGATRP